MAVTFVSGSGIGPIDVVSGITIKENSYSRSTVWSIHSSCVPQVTTIPSQQCTQSFDGTSAACPIAAAIVALTLEVK